MTDRFHTINADWEWGYVKGEFPKLVKLYLRLGFECGVWSGSYLCMALPKRVRIVEEDLGKERAWGMCFYSKALIKIHPFQPEESRLDTLVHELLHMACPDWSEKKISRYATFLAKELWKDGYRRSKPAGESSTCG